MSTKRIKKYYIVFQMANELRRPIFCDIYATVFVPL